MEGGEPPTPEPKLSPLEVIEQVIGKGKGETIIPAYCLLQDREVSFPESLQILKALIIEAKIKGTDM